MNYCANDNGQLIEEEKKEQQKSDLNANCKPFIP